MMATSFITRSDDTLIIRSRVVVDPKNPNADRFYTWELEQKPRTWDDIQKIIDGLTDQRESISAVWRVETNDFGMPLTVDDITGMFDVRTAQEISEAARHAEAVAERRFLAVPLHSRLERAFEEGRIGR